MDVHSEVLQLLDQVLSLQGSTSSFTEDTPLLGAIPELDSMAVVSLITAIENHFGFAIDDDEIDGEVFANVGSLSAFVAGKLSA